ncbi:MAG: PaaI family thioesterase, partial [Rhodospirillales bacterium]
GKACQKVSEGATSFVTIDLNVAFLASGSGRIVAEGRVLRAGRSIVFCEGEARDAEGVLLARASGVFRPFVPR